MASMGMGPGLVVTVRASRFEWAHRHAAPLIGSVVAFVVGMDYVTLWPRLRTGTFGIFWAPSDLWGSYLAAVGLVHGHLQSPFLGMTGSLVILAPAAAVGNALHLQVGPNFSPYAAPTGWLLMGPWILLLSSTALFAFDAAAERLGVGRRRRIALCVVEGLLVLNVTVKWGHPEDAVALGLAVFALLDADRGHLMRAGWLLGVAVAVQPLAVLALPAGAVMVLDRHGRGETQQLVVRAVVPYLLLLVPSLIDHFSATVEWLVEQPNWPGLNHRTPFSALAAGVAHSPGAITAGPARLVGIVLAAVLAAVLGRRGGFERCLWVATAGFLLWAATDSVLDAYYTWPVLALAVLLSTRLALPWALGSSALAGVATWFSNLAWVGSWSWWSLMVAMMAALVAVAWHAAGLRAREDHAPMTTPDTLVARGPGTQEPGEDAAPLWRRGRAVVPPWTG